MVESFSKNLPGVDWVRGLLKRYSNIVCRRVATDIARCCTEVSPQCISKYFDNLQQVLGHVPPQNIYN